MFSEDFVKILVKYGSDNKKSINAIYNELKQISQSIKEYRKFIAYKSGENMMSDDYNETLTQDFNNYIATLNNEYKAINDIIKEIQPFCSERNLTETVKFRITTNDINCPDCYKKNSPDNPKLEHTKSSIKIFDSEGNLTNTIEIPSMYCPIHNKFYISRDLYWEIKETIGIENTNMEISLAYCLPKEIKYYDFIVISNIEHCSYSEHHIKDIIANISTIDEQGRKTNQSIRANYCQECDRFVILKADFNQLNGIPYCKVKDETIQVTPKETDGYDNTDESTLFNQRGYNVNCNENLPVGQRQRILKEIIVHKEKTIAETCSYIDSLISRGQKRGWTNAVSRWETDRAYVCSLEILNDEEYNVGTIIKRYSYV